ncbi:putative aldose 1-epimerase [Psilocybe cubensis]|uniref:Galactose mutarotase-like protein n=2 Tax=Psilocybe cubensis TaxID=181762 RepID=A0A8H7XY73_PSICU|nr:putative aldose 1-epimerase [Psilocybe cubensis]KAH9482386.1 putative aldose 1-epimerase [Psilocybe cubensis]
MALLRGLTLFLLGVRVSSLVPSNSAQNNEFNSILIAAPDGSARAAFIPFGAIATNFWVKDKHGVFRDILLGFDDHTLYQSDAEGHPYFGPIVGRYANRIRNGTFTIPISKDASGPNKFFVPRNEGNNTLHGGFDGFDRRVWQTTKVSSSSVTFTLVDPAGTQGFPGTVLTTVTYTLEPKSTWNIKIHAVASAKTPIMLSGHHYWNFEAYQESQDLVGHFVQFESSKFVATDGQLIPTGKLTPVAGTPMDFRKAKSIGASIPLTAQAQFCGSGCVGFDNCWVFDTVDQTKKPKFSMWSVNSGIKLDIFTNQPAVQVYTCNGIFNASLPIPRKATQGGPNNIYADHSCVVIENESLIDAINNPELGVDQIFGPGRPYDWESTYVFSTIQD